MNGITFIYFVVQPLVKPLEFFSVAINLEGGRKLKSIRNSRFFIYKAKKKRYCNEIINVIHAQCQWF